MPNREPSQTALTLASACKLNDKTEALAESISYAKGAEAELLGGKRTDAGEDSLNGNASGAELPSAASDDGIRSAEAERVGENKASLFITPSEYDIASNLFVQTGMKAD